MILSTAMELGNHQHSQPQNIFITFNYYPPIILSSLSPKTSPLPSVRTDRPILDTCT